MSTINFYLKKPDKKGLCSIMLTYQDRGQKYRYFTKLKIKAVCWKNQRVKNNYTGYSEINGLLDELENNLKEIEREALFLKKEYSIEIIKNKFQSKLGKSTNEKDFFYSYDRFIEDSKATKSRKTIQAYEGTKEKLKAFMEAKNVGIKFENINQIFYESFVNYMIIDLGHLNNTVGKHIKTLKTFLRYAIDHEFTNHNYNFKKFKVFAEDADIIYLTESELMKIYRLENLSKTLLKVRDSFCFACFTGLRFSDIDKLSDSHIKAEFIEMKAEKTKDSLKIPLNSFAQEILARNKNLEAGKPLPKGFSNQKTNQYIKEIAGIAKIDEIVSLEKFTGSKKIIINKPKSEFISTHTARRTFVTLSLEKGIRSEVVMAMTGHKSYRTFKRYIKITDKVMQAEMERVWSKPLLKAV